MYNIIGTTKYWVSVSVILVVATFAVWIAWGLNLGIEFTGGSSMQLHFEQSVARPNSGELATELQQIGIVASQVQPIGDADVILKLQHIDNDQRQQILDKYENREVSEVSFFSIGPTLGVELKNKAVTAIILVLLAIIGYISYVFRKVSNGPVASWMFGVAAVVALIHDILIVIGVFVVLGHFYDVQLDTLFVTALLTILGFSVHDTIVVFDRIREGLKRHSGENFREIVNLSINTTMIRSINTSLTTLLVLLALYLLGGAAIQYFVLALIIGIISGTYSSIFIASPLLLLAQRLLKRA